MKLLIVDDDPDIVSVIQDTIDWSALGFDEVFCAYHFDGAKPFLQRRVDVVICDVEMPRGSGLDLIRWARAQGIESEFIFLTCHDSFSFVQDAMRERAHAYVLKPFKPEELVQEVLKAVDHIRRSESLSTYEVLWRDNKNAVEQRFWRDFMLLDTLPEQGVLASRLDNRGIDIDKSGLYRLVLIKLAKASEPTAGMDAEIRWFEYHGSQLAAQEILQEPAHQGRLFYFERHGWQYVGCILPDEPLESIVARCERFLARYKDRHSEYIACYLGTPTPLALLPKERARLEAQSHQEYRTGLVLPSDERNEESTSGRLLDLSRMQTQLEHGERLALMRDMKEQLETLMAKGCLNLQTMFAIRSAVSEEVYTYLRQYNKNTEFLFADSSYCYLQFNAHASTYDMIKWMNYLFLKVIGQEGSKQQESPAVAKALAFIHMHYAEDITREEVARCVYLAPAYFAKQFKREKGITIKDYINYCRVTAAREQLKRTDLSITEVANRVGFTDSSYFAVVFKKIVGLSPSDFRQSE